LEFIIVIFRKKSGFSWEGRLVGLLFLGSLAFSTIIPVAPVPVWLTLDMVVRWSALLVFLTVVYQSFFSKSKTFNVHFDFLDILLLLGLGWVMLSAWNSAEKFQSFGAFKSFLAIVVWWFALRRIWIRWPELFSWFERLVLALAGALSFWVLIAGLFHHFEAQAGPFPNVNGTASFLGVVLIILMLRIMHKSSPWTIGFFLFVFAAWGSTRSRGAFLALGAAAILYIIFHYAEIEDRLRRFQTKQWFAFAAAILIMVLSVAFMVERLFEGDKIDPRASWRPYIWASAFQMASDQPVFGFGPGTFETIYPYYRSPDLWNTTTGFAHNEFLQAASECGWPALGLVLVFLAVVFWNLWHLARRNPPFRTLAPPLWAAEISLLVLIYTGIHNLVDFTYHEWSILLVVLGYLTFALRNERASGVEINLDFSWTAFRGVGLLTVFFLVWILGFGVWRDTFAQWNYFRGEQAQAQGQWDSAEAFLQKSTVLQPDLMGAWNSLGDIAIERAQQAKNNAVKTAYFHQAEDDFNRAVRVSPHSVTPQENQVELMEIQRRYDQALDLQAQLTQKLPNLPTNYLEEGKILMAQGKPVEAIPVADKAIALDQYFLEAYLLKARALEAIGRKADAVQVYQDVETKLQSVNLLDKIPLVEDQIRRLKGGA
jgi:O-antigen ligase